MESDILSEDPSNVPLMAVNSQDEDHNMNSGTKRVSSSCAEEEQEKLEHIPALTKEEMLAIIDGSKFSKANKRLYHLTNRSGNVKQMQELMSSLGLTTYDKVCLLVGSPVRLVPGQWEADTLPPIIVNSLLQNDMEMLTYLLTIYENVKTTMEKMQPTAPGSRDFYPLALYPFLINNGVGETGNLLHHLSKLKESSPEIINRLSKYPIFNDLINMPDNNGSTPLVKAIKSVINTKLASEMVDLGSHVDILNKQGESPVFLATESGKVELVKKILTSGCRATQQDIVTSKHIYGEGHNIFYPAILGSSNDMVKYLRSSPHVHNSWELLAEELRNDDGTLAECVTKWNMTDVLEFWLALEDNPHLLMRAVLHRRKDTILTILDTNNAVRHLKSIDLDKGRNVLHYGAEYPEIITLLLEAMERTFDKPSDIHEIINRVDIHGCTANHYAAMAGNVESLQMLAKWSWRCNKDDNRTEYDNIVSCVECKTGRCLKKISDDVIKNAIEGFASDTSSVRQFMKPICITSAARLGRTDLIRYLLNINVPIAKECGEG